MSALSKDHLSWFGIIRLGLVQTSLGAIVVLMTTTLNRIMVVELALLATIPGILVALHYTVQLTRPRWGYGADVGGRRTPWIICGIGILAIAGVLAAFGTWVMESSFVWGFVVSVLAFALVGTGAGMAGTNLLALLAIQTAPRRRPAAASIVWMMMIAGFAVTAGTVGALIDPFSFERLLLVTTAVSIIGFVVTVLAVFGLEKSVERSEKSEEKKLSGSGFIQAFKEIWAEDKARQFTVFIFISMLAYSAQDLILEPFAGLVFNYTPGESTKLGGLMHAGVLVGMALVAIVGTAYGKGRFGSMRFWAVSGCLIAAVAFVSLTLGAFAGPGWPLDENVFLLGFGSGAFAVAAIGSMMGLASEGRSQREGTRMGLWGASQAIAFGIGVFLGAVAVDLMRLVFETNTQAYAAVFALEAVLFVWSALIAYKVSPEGALSNLNHKPSDSQIIAEQAGFKGV